MNKYETIGILGSVGLMAIALFLLRVENSAITSAVSIANESQTAIVVVSDGNTNRQKNLSVAVADSLDGNGDVQRLIIDDIQIGTGSEVKEGDTVTVDYIGTLQGGQQFDNSYEKGSPFTFTVGDGKVISGWETGLIGMQVGGQRVLVIPSDLAYGNRSVGPIPSNSTLLFAIKLLSIK